MQLDQNIPRGYTMEVAIFWLLPMDFVKQLVKIRKKRGFTQQTLADAVGLYVNQIKRYEAGNAQPTLDTLVRLAKELNTTLDELVFGDDKERSPIEELKLQFEALSHF